MKGFIFIFISLYSISLGFEQNKQKTSNLSLESESGGYALLLMEELLSYKDLPQIYL